MNHRDEQQTFDVGDECVVVAESTSGDIEVSSWDAPRVSVIAPDGSATVQRDGATFHIRPTLRAPGDLVVRVPHHCDLTLHLILISGDVRLRQVSGALHIQTTTGDIEGHEVEGDLRVHTVSGDVTMRGSRLGSVSLDTVSGDSIFETSLDPNGDYRAHSVSGDIRLLVPREQALTVRSQTLSGEFECRLPFEERHQGWGKVEALVNGGGVEFLMRSASGGISVRASHEGAPTPAAEPQPQAAAAHETRPLNETRQPEPEPFGVEEPAGQPRSEEEAASPETRRMRILKDIEEGKLSVSEGLARLRSLE